MNSLIIAGLAVASISYTISIAKIFKNQREWIKSKNSWLGELLSCPYCTSHYVSMAVSPWIFTNIQIPAIINFIITTFCLVAIAALWTQIILLLSLKSTQEVENLRQLLAKSKQIILDQQNKIEELQNK